MQSQQKVTFESSNLIIQTMEYDSFVFKCPLPINQQSEANTNEFKNMSYTERLLRI